MIPKVSFILPITRTKYLTQTINGILSQTLQEFEVIILDNANINPQYNDKRIIVFNTITFKFIESINFGISKSKSDIIMHSSDDDIDLPNKAEETYNAITHGYDLFYANYYWINSNEEITGEVKQNDFNYNKFIYENCGLNFSTGGYSKSTSPIWREDFHFLGDVVFILDCCNKSIKFKYKDIFTSKTRRWSEQMYNRDKHYNLRDEEGRKLKQLFNIPNSTIM